MDNIVTLADEEGNTQDFQVVDFIDVEQLGQPGIFRKYGLLIPIDDPDPEQDEVLVMRWNGKDFEMINNEAEFQLVVKVLEDYEIMEDWV